MQSTKIRKMELIDKINKIPVEKLDEIEISLKNIISQFNLAPSEPVNLKGIWKNKGFEKISNLESELKCIKSDLNNSILNREY